MNGCEPIHVAHWGMTAGHGGLESFVMNMYRHMDRSRIQFDFLEPVDLPHMEYEDEIEALGGRIYRVMESQLRHPLKAHKSLKDFFQQHEEIKIVHVHANQPYAYPLKVAKECGINVRILHSHNSDLIDYSQGNMVKKILLSVRDVFVRHQIGKYPSDYFACSDLAAEYMFPNEKYTFIPNGIDTNRFKFDSAVRLEMRHKLGISSSTKIIGFCGWLIERKNPLFCLDVFREYVKKNDDACLLMIGKGVLEKEIRRRVEEYNLDDKVLLLGRRNDMNCLYSAMDAFILPSAFEGLAVTCVEAQTSGLPCLISSTASHLTRITDLVQFMSLEKSASEWAQSLENLLHQSSAKNRTGFELIVREAGFDADDVARKLMERYQFSVELTQREV